MPLFAAGMASPVPLPLAQVLHRALGPLAAVALGLGLLLLLAVAILILVGFPSR